MLSERGESMKPSNELGDFYLFGLGDEVELKLMGTWLNKVVRT